MKETFIAQIKNGQPTFLSDYNKARFKEWCKENEGQKIQIKRVSSKVSDNKRGWYFASVIPFMQQLVPYWENLSSEQLHEVLKTEFNGFTIETKQGKRKYPLPVANRDVDTEQFDNYILRIGEWVRQNYALELPDSESFKEQRDKGFDDKEYKVEYPQEKLGQTPF
jgi:hypothetical protein